MTNLHPLTRLANDAWSQLYGQPIGVNGYLVTFKAPYFAEVDTGGRSLRVTDYDCDLCGPSDGNGNCAHQSAMFEALDQARGITPQDREDVEAYHEQVERHSQWLSGTL